MIVNGGMEAFEDGIPTGWSAEEPFLVSTVSQQGRVHTGEYAVHLADGAVLYQEIDLTPGCFYRLAFFARGEGSQVSVAARVIYRNAQGKCTEGLRITVRGQDMVNANRVFAYYQGIASAAPEDAVAVRIEFAVTANGGQGMDLDDVSFAVM